MPPANPAPLEVPDVPSDSENSVSNQVYVIHESESDSDEENRNGYLPLSQDPENIPENDTDGEENIEDGTAQEFNSIYSSYLLPPPVDEPIQIDHVPKDIKMDNDQIENIKSIMKGITLPISNMPNWANVVPEEKWKAALLENMQKTPQSTGQCSKSLNSEDNSDEDIHR